MGESGSGNLSNKVNNRLLACSEASPGRRVPHAAAAMVSRWLFAVAAVALALCALSGLVATTRSLGSTALLSSTPPRHADKKHLDGGVPPRHAARDLMSNILGGMEEQTHKDVEVRPSA